ncbi:MAG: serine hydrolase domain-containing protein [Longimicrobiales bacterium]|nr:serine hydrolase domain-containing protein [Longimicrobiales bacterium]
MYVSVWQMALLVPALIAAVPLQAQDRDDVPRTRTFPGIENPALPYAQPEDVGLSSEKLDRLGDDIVSWVADSVLVGAELLIVKDGKVVFHEAYGWNDREEQRPIRRNSVFWVGSMAKPVTAAAVLILIEQGRLALDDRVNEYIPGIPNDSLRVRHLLTHTSGYAFWGDEQEYDAWLGTQTSLKSVIDAHVAAGPVRPFGEYTYSNFNYDALGYIVEEVTGVTLATFTAEHLLGPIGLDDTYPDISPDTSPWTLRVNDLYQRDPETGEYQKIWDVSRDMEDPWAFYLPSGGLFATAMDYARFMALWLNKGKLDDVRLLSEATVEEALRPHTGRGAGGRDPYGFGWRVLVSGELPTDDGMPAAFEHGGTAGTYAAAFPPADALVVYMTHSRHGVHRRRFRNSLVAHEIFDGPGPYLVAGLVPLAETDVLELTPNQKQQYVGTYRSGDPDNPEEIVHEVFLEDGRVIVRFWSPRSEEGDLLHLVPIGENRFGLSAGKYPDRPLDAIERDGEVRFTVEDGQAQGFEVLYSDEVVFTAQRVE